MLAIHAALRNEIIWISTLCIHITGAKHYRTERHSLRKSAAAGVTKHRIYVSAIQKCIARPSLVCDTL